MNNNNLVKKLMERIKMEISDKAAQVLYVVVDGSRVRVSVKREVYNRYTNHSQKLLADIKASADGQGLKTAWGRDHLMIWK